MGKRLSQQLGMEDTKLSWEISFSLDLQIPTGLLVSTAESYLRGQWTSKPVSFIWRKPVFLPPYQTYASYSNYVSFPRLLTGRPILHDRGLTPRSVPAPGSPTWCFLCASHESEARARENKLV